MAHLVPAVEQDWPAIGQIAAPGRLEMPAFAVFARNSAHAVVEPFAHFASASAFAFASVAGVAAPVGRRRECLSRIPLVRDSRIALGCR